jgi:hypothetical protein
MPEKREAQSESEDGANAKRLKTTHESEALEDDDDAQEQLRLNSWTGDAEDTKRDRSRNCPYLDTINR